MSILKSDEKAPQLIEKYKKHPCLWGPKHENYFKKPKKMDAWCEIASIFNFKDEDAEHGPEHYKKKKW